MPSIGPLELAIVGVIFVLLFGAKRLPEIGRSLGGGIRELKDSLTVKEEDSPKKQLPASGEKERSSAG
jgi:sec-independent protein translocase protein TatA